MQLSEITANQFKKQLKDPVRQSILSRVQQARKTLKPLGMHLRKVRIDTPASAAFLYSDSPTKIHFVVDMPDKERSTPIKDYINNTSRTVHKAFSGIVIPEMSDSIYNAAKNKMSFVLYLNLDAK